MATETARVVALEPDALWLETIQRSTCGGCAAQDSCGHSRPGGDVGRRRGRIRVSAGATAVAQYKLDDQVLIEFPDDTILRGAAVAYGLPLLGLLAGALAGARGFGGTADVAVAIGAAIGLVLGFALVGRHSARHRGDPALQPVLKGPELRHVQTVTVR